MNYEKESGSLYDKRARWASRLRSLRNELNDTASELGIDDYFYNLFNGAGDVIHSLMCEFIDSLKEDEMKVDIEDTLQKNVDEAIENLEELIEETWEDEEEREELTAFEIQQKLDYDGRIHEIIDSAVPIYTKEIKDTWYLHEHKLLEAYENEGLGKNPHENDGMVAIFCYISQKVFEWLFQEYN